MKERIRAKEIKKKGKKEEQGREEIGGVYYCTERVSGQVRVREAEGERDTQRGRERERERERGCRQREGKTSSLKGMMSVSAAEPRSPTRRGEDSLLQKTGWPGWQQPRPQRERGRNRERERERERDKQRGEKEAGESLVNEILQVRMPRSHPSLSSFISAFLSRAALPLRFKNCCRHLIPLKVMIMFFFF